MGAFEDRDREPNTPGLRGYLLAALVATVPMTAVVYAQEGASYGLAAAVLIWLYVAFGALWFAIVVLPIVHVSCSRVQQQWVHVTATAVMTSWLVIALMLFAYGYPTDADDVGTFWKIVALVGLSAGAGRAVVVPLVHRRRRTWSAGSGLEALHSA